MTPPVCPDRQPAPVVPDLRIVSVQPDRDHAFVEVLGDSADGNRELRQRVDALLVAGARYVLVDLSGAGGVELGSTFAVAGRVLAQRRGWLRTVGAPRPFGAGRYEASLPELFAMYRAPAGAGRPGVDR